MAISIKGFNPTNGIAPQPDFEAVKTKNGGWIGTQTFKIKTSDMTSASVSAKFSKGTQLSVIDPNNPEFGQYLYIDNIQVLKQHAGFSTIRVNLAGYSEFSSDPDNPAASVETYVLRGVLKEVSLLEHPDVQALAESERSILKEINDGQMVIISTGDFGFSQKDANGKDLEQTALRQPAAGDSDTYARLIATGNSTYLVPQYTWTKTWESENPIKNTEINNLGKIDTPDGEPPEANGSRDWLMTSLDQELAGQLYRSRIEWTLSERQGWNSNVYST